MKASELREKTPDELHALRLELAREEFNLRMQKSIGQSPKPSEFKRIRRAIARLNTVATEQKAMGGA